MKRRGAPLILLLSGVAWCAAADAACTVANSTLAFGNYNPVSGSPTTANATITVQCSALISANATVPYTVFISAGGSGSTTNRTMSGAATLPYNIYTSSSYTTVWDDTTGVAGSVTIIGLLGLPVVTFGSATQTAYGRILALQPVPAGSYTDALTLTVSF